MVEWSNPRTWTVVFMTEDTEHSGPTPLCLTDPDQLCGRRRHNRPSRGGGAFTRREEDKISPPSTISSLSTGPIECKARLGVAFAWEAVRLRWPRKSERAVGGNKSGLKLCVRGRPQRCQEASHFDLISSLQWEGRVVVGTGQSWVYSLQVEPESWVYTESSREI